jgi:DNA processing protein
MGVALSDAERLASLRLARSDNVGPVTYRELLRLYGSAAAALEALPELSRRGGSRRNVAPYPREAAEAELHRLDAFGARALFIGEPEYPIPLAALDAPPPLLYVKGNVSLLQRPTLAIVGSRKCSAAGAKLGRAFARDVGRAGFVIASGLARGVDAMAHQGAMDTGTVAVLAGGLDVVYPPEHDELQRIVGERGCLVSEMSLGFIARGIDFPRRNRIVSGLSLAVLVIEAARRSGSLVTARLAAEQGREVFAVPGHPLDPRAEGTNRLIKSGATLVTEAEDILGALAPLVTDRRPLLREPPQTEMLRAAPPSINHEVRDDDLDRVLGALGPAPIDIDTLVRGTGLDIRHVQIALLELSLAGRLERHGGGLVSLGPQSPGD